MRDRRRRKTRGPGADTGSRPTRGPTVSPRRWGASQPTQRSPSNSIFAWLKRESIALLALSGAALTVLAQLATVMPVTPQIATWLAEWQQLTQTFWRPPLNLVGLPLHHDMAAALNVSAFMALLGLGARMSARLAGKPLAPMGFDRFFDDQTWPSLIAFGALCMVFLVGHGASSADTPVVMGSEELGKYAFAVIVTLGYFAGDFIGHRQFHRRLYRLAVIVAAVAAVNLAILSFD